MRSGRTFLVALAAGLLTGPVWAQLDQYISPGSLGLPQVSTKEQIEKAVAEARWRLGGLRVEPWFGIRDVSYVQNVFAEDGEGTSDVTATVGLGLNAYLPVGSKTTVAANILPEYAWWQELDDLSGIHFRYGAGLFAYFNRITVEAKGTSSDAQTKVSSELGAPAQVTSRSGDVTLAVDIAGPFAFFASVGRTESEYEQEPGAPRLLDQLPLLDRREDIVRAGLRYERGGFRLGVGAQRSKTQFDRTERDRSNSGEGPVLILDLEGNRLSGGFQIAYLTLDAEQGSEFGQFRDLSGRFQLQIETGHRLATSLYGTQHVLYTLAAGSAHAVERRVGVAAGLPLGWRTSLRAFAESGTSDFVGSGEAGRRSDDLRSVGGEITLKLRRSLNLTVGVLRTEQSSNLAGFDRSTTTLRSALTLGAGESVW